MSTTEEVLASARSPVTVSARQRLRDRMRQRKRLATAALRRIERRKDATLAPSFAQQRLWLLDQMTAGNHAYNMSLAIEIHGPLNVEHLRASVQLILDRHEVFRTSFANDQGRPKLSVASPAPFALAPERVADDTDIQRIWRHERAHVFSLSEGGLIRLRLLEVDTSRHALIITMHHITSDAWSLGVFFNELLSHYRELSRGNTLELRPLPIQYADYAHWQRENLRNGTWDGQVEYWRRQLNHLPGPLALPTDYPRPLEPSLRGTAASIHIPKALTDRLKALASESHATLFMVLLAGFSALLHRRCAADDIPIGTPVANRNRAETEALIGFFVNTLVLRCNLAGQPTFRELLRRTRETALEAYANQDVPFDHLVEILNPERDLTRSPLFQVMFALQNAPVEDVAVENLGLRPLLPDSDETSARFELTFNLTETGDGLRGVLEYRSDLFAPDTVDNLLTQYLWLLRQAAERPDEPIASCDLVTPWDKNQYASQRRLPKGSCDSVLACVEALPPDWIAVCDELGDHSVAEILHRADALAARLGSDGSRAGDCIGIVEDESVRTLVVVLGVLRLGAAVYFIPASANAFRRRYVLASARISKVIEASSLADVWDELTEPVARPRSSSTQASAPLRFHLESASGRLLLAQITQRAFLGALLSVYGSVRRTRSDWLSPLVGCMLVSLLKGVRWSPPRAEATQLSSAAVDDRREIPFGAVVAEGDRLAPIGTPGELCYAGITLIGAGAEHVLADPLSPEADVVRTGFRGVMHADGTVHRIPATDEQQRSNERRAAIASESTLRSFYRTERLALARQGGQWVMFAERGELPEDEPLATVIARLKEQRPPQSLPARRVDIDQWPLMSDGDVDRRALIAPERQVTAFEAPEGTTEETLAVVWSDLLGVSRIARTDNFFSLGGYSLMASQLVSRIRDVFGVEVSLREIFESRDLKSQAQLLERESSGETGELPAVSVVDRSGPLALSFSQQRLWFLSRMMAPNAVYNIHYALRLSGELDEGALVRSLTAVVNRHEALRTRFAEVNGEAVQRIDPPLDSSVDVETVGSEEELRERCRAERGHCFDLSNEPLYRLKLLRYQQQWVLLATLHHIVTDGWSMGVFFKEVTQLYEAERRGVEAQLPVLPIQYADYAQWQREQLSAQVVNRQMQYWKGQLEGLPPLLELPTDAARPAEQSYRGGAKLLRIPAQQVQALQELNRSSGTTLFMSLIGAFAVLLGRYAGQNDVAIGTPISNRRHSQTEGLMGFFLNSLVLRFDVSGHRSFGQLLKATREMALQAYAHQEIPFEYLVEQLNPQRSLSHAPLFQVSCSLVDTPVQAQGFAGLQVQPLRFEEDGAGVSRYDLTFNFSQLPDGSVLGHLEYNSDLFSAARMQRLLGHYERLLAAVVQSPQSPIGELDYLSEQEREQQLVQWNATQRPYRRACVHELFAQQARSCPDAVAVVSGDKQLSYAELERRANRLAQYLVRAGVRVESRVGLCVERSLEMVVGLLGILKAGAAYVPLDASYPAGRLRQMITVSGCEVILSEQHLMQELEWLSEYATVPLDGPWHEQLMGDCPDQAPNVPVTADHLAYVIFTSGSTGVPKGVLISHANIAALVGSGDGIQVDAAAIVAQAASHAFDAITYELWSPLLAGARVVIIDKDTLLSPPQLQRCLAEQAVNRLFITTALFNRISQECPQAFGPLQQVFFGGEAYSAAAIARVFQQGAPNELRHVYGPTESTTFATGYVLQAEKFFRDGQAPIGHPLGNTTAYVLQGEQLAAVGALGELCLGGEGLARGYLADARLTAQKFVPHPYARKPGERLYRTGDLVRATDEGAVQFVGRGDEQVKIRGFRIELGEIEQALREHPNVQQVVVLARQEGERHLVAYVVPRGETDAGLAGQFSQHLKGRIPDYAIPRAYVLLESLPLNANGKIDRQRLPAPDESAYARAEYLAPRTSLEVQLARLWQESLGTEQPIGIRDNYFAIGGDSIRSIGLVSAARAAGLEFAIKDLFAHPTIEELAQQVRAVDATPAAVPEVLPFALLSEAERAQLPALHQGQPLQDAYPLSLLQQGMWFHSLQHPELSVYHCVITFAVKARWERELFARAFDLLIRRHAILRTDFDMRAERPLHLVKDYRAPALAVHDYRGQQPCDRNALIEAWARDEHRKCLTLQELWRCAVLLFDDEHIQFGLSFHHALWDGWSDASLVAELFSYYRALLKGEAPQVPPPPPAYNRYIALEQQALASPGHREYWARRLGGARLPWWSNRPRGKSKHVFCEVTEQMSADVIALADALNVQEKSVWCTAYLVLTSMLAGDDSILGSVVTHGRPELAGAEQMAGLFLNCLPIHVNLRGRTWRELIVQVNELLLEQHEHRHYPLAKIQTDLRMDFSASLFGFVNFHVIGDSMADSGILGSGSFGLDETNYQLSVHVQKHDAARRHLLRVTIDPAVFDDEFQERIRRYAGSVIDALTRADTQLIDKCRLMGDERDEVLALGGGRMPAEAQPARFIHEYFEEQVRADAGAIALTCETQSLTYAELNRRANQLAHYLRARGVGPDQLVGICIERSVEMVVALLGVLKSGGAYVPLDPSYPGDRLAYMLEDAACPIVLTQEKLEDVLPASNVLLIALDRQWQEIATHPDTNLSPESTRLLPQHLAYVMYTSGSTGAPKGVMIHHSGLGNYLRWALQTYAPERGAGSPVTSSFAFDATVTSLYTPLLSGRTVHLVREGEELEGLERLLQDGTAWSLVKISPAHLSLLGERCRQLAGHFALDAFVIGGEALAPATVQAWQALSPGTRLINEYGPTETVVGCSIYEVPPNWIAAASVPIGRPIAQTQMYILDANGMPVPVGVPGEIYIGGAGVARGYHNRARLTAERFVPDTFGGLAGARLYRTGDLGRIGRDGHLEYLGRNDHQVKVRGFRIELGEIEAQLQAHPSVREAVVLAREDNAREDNPGEKRLVAYITCEEGSEPEIPDLRSTLQALLPEYMIPSAFVMLEQMPLTSNGKIDRRALLPPERSAYGAKDFQAPQGELEGALADIWRDLLRVGQVSRHDNFFELGGHSLLAVQLMTRIQQVLGRACTLPQLFEYPTVQLLARELAGGQRIAVTGIQRAERTQPLPLSWAQERVWFMVQMERGAASLHIPLALRLKGDLDEAALEAALDQIVQRHEALRTTFVMDGGSATQVITARGLFALRRVDLSAVQSPESRLLAETSAEINEPFDLATGPLIRGRLVRLAAEDHVLLITMHHIVSDAWSVRVMMQELAALYAAEQSGEPHNLPALPIQYADYAVWQRQWLRGQVMDEQLSYWKDHLAGAPALLQLPTDRPRPLAQSYRGDSVVFSLGPQLSRKLGELTREHDVTLFMAVYAGLSILLSRLSGQDDIVIGTQIANRSRTELEGLIGFFINTLALRCRLGHDPTVSELLAQTRAMTLQAYAHQDVPFDQVVDAVQPPRSLQFTPLFQVVLMVQTLQTLGTDALSLPGLTVAPQETPYPLEKYDMTLSLVDNGEEVVGGASFASDLFDRSSIERWVSYLKAVLGAMAENTDRHIRSIDLMTASERELLMAFSATGDDDD